MAGYKENGPCPCGECGLTWGEARILHCASGHPRAEFGAIYKGKVACKKCASIRAAAYIKKRRKTDPEFRAREIRDKVEYNQHRYHTDPEFRAKKLAQDARRRRERQTEARAALRGDHSSDGEGEGAIQGERAS